MIEKRQRKKQVNLKSSRTVFWASCRYGEYLYRFQGYTYLIRCFIKLWEHLQTISSIKSRTHQIGNSSIKSVRIIQLLISLGQMKSIFLTLTDSSNFWFLGAMLAMLARNRGLIWSWKVFTKVCMAVTSLCSTKIAKLGISTSLGTLKKERMFLIFGIN